MRDREAVEDAGSVAPRTAGPTAATTLPARLLTLQRLVGNRAVNRILARDAWTEAVRYDKWLEAAKSLGDLKDKDVNDRLGQLNVGQLGALLGGTRDWGTNGNGETPSPRRARSRPASSAARSRRPTPPACRSSCTTCQTPTR
jgi:hypothetical protein